MRLSIVIPAILFFSCSAEHQTESASELTNSDKLTIETVIKDSVESRACELTALSNQFDIFLDIKRVNDEREVYDSCIVKLIISDKKNKVKLDSIEYTSLYLFKSTYSNCDSVTSFSTKYHGKREVLDNNFGDIVVADFNFDDKDDIAFITEIGGNGGPIYSYHIQTADNKFIADSYLTDSVIYFPQNIDRKKKQLTTLVHAGACCMSVNVYQVNKSGVWKQISNKTDTL